MFLQQIYIIANILMLLDGMICIATGYIAYTISLELQTGVLVMSWNDFIGSVIFVMFFNNYTMGKFGFYSEKRFPSYWAVLKSLSLVVLLDFVALSTGAFLLGIQPFSRVFVSVYAPTAFLSFTITRILLDFYLDRRALTSRNSRQILLVGTGERVRHVADALAVQRTWGHQIAGCLNVDGGRRPQAEGIPVLGDLEGFDKVLREHEIDEVFFALPRDFSIDLGSCLRKCEEMGVAFRIVPGMFDMSDPSLRVETIQGIPTLAAHSIEASASGLMYKRCLDLIAGFVGFLLFLLLYPIVGLAIKLDSPGPVLFKQHRVGRNNRIFYLYKFRSMVTDAEAKKEELLARSEMSGPIFKMEDDPRITRVGKFLRKTSLDEFPQFINVLRGDMSLVGTRPPTLDEVVQYEDWHRRRISIKPGITGLWQISGRNEIKEFTEVVKLDLQYIDRWQFWNDLMILWKTFWVVLARKGAK
jgi:exopolysaccharide biosynthesis polyprenyl glycosylphosphotransferase